MNKRRISAEGPALDEYLKDSRCGYCQKHTGKSEKVPENADGKKHEQGVEAGGIPHNVRVNEVGICLLDQEQHQHGGSRFCKTSFKKGGDKSGYHSEDRTEVRNQIQQSAQNPNDDGEVHLQQGKGYGREKGHDQAVDECSFQKCINYGIDFMKNFTEHSMVVLFQNQRQELVPQQEKKIPVFQKIYGSDDSQKKSDSCAGKGGNGRCDGFQ